jgi:Na+-driven multidrug efflux pump
MGQYAALSNLLRIANPIFITLATLIVPAVALIAVKGHNPRMLSAAQRVTRDFALRAAALLLPYWSLLLLFPSHAILLLYPRRPEYRGLDTELRMFVGISVLTMINLLLASIFNGMGRNRRALVAQIAGAAACVVVTIPLTIRLGLEGILIGTLVSNAVVVVTQIGLYRVLKHDLREAEAPIQSEQLIAQTAVS